MSATRLGRLLIALTIAALGALNLAWGRLSYVWQPVPKWVPASEPLAYASGVILLACGLGMLVPRAARLATLVLWANLVLWLLLIKIPAVVSAPGVAVQWEQLGETLMLLGGTWALLAALSAPSRSASSGRGLLDGPPAARAGRLVFALAMPMMGVAHFAYVQLTASMIPGWIPFHAGFVYLTGAAHIATGLALLCGVLPRLAATAEAVMISIFTLVANTAMLIARPASHDMWVELLVAAVLAGASWAVAGSLAGAPWGLRSSQVRYASAGGISTR